MTVKITMTDDDLKANGYTKDSAQEFVDEVVANKPPDLKGPSTVLSSSPVYSGSGGSGVATFKSTFSEVPVLKVPVGHEIDLHWEYPKVEDVQIAGPRFDDLVSQAEYVAARRDAEESASRVVQAAKAAAKDSTLRSLKLFLG